MVERYWLRHIVTVAAGVVGCSAALAGQGRFTIPYVTGQPGVQPFTGHLGWVDAYPAGHGKGTFARIGSDASFNLPKPKKNKPICLIAMFDRVETPPVIVPDYPTEGDQDVLIPVEYACVPAGYPEVWDQEYKIRATNYYQTFVARGTQLYGVSLFDGPKIVDWGNKINASVHKDGPRGEALTMRFQFEPMIEHVSAGHSDHELPRIGWRHGDVRVEPGRTYAVRVGGYRSHGGKNFKLDAYVRPDKDDGYPGGRVFRDGQPTEGDLCCLIFGNSHGQLVENHIRSEEWELFIPHHAPTTNWGQSFTAHGVSLAGISFWAAGGDGSEPVACEVRVRPDGAWEHPIGPRKVAVAHKSPDRPIIRYTDAPKPVPGYEAYYKLPSDLFQVAYLPDELPLTPGKTYYIEVVSSRPIMMYADGDFYHDGYAYYEGLKVDRVAAGGRMTKHSDRWTLAMNIVTYAKPDGKPLAPAK